MGKAKYGGNKVKVLLFSDIHAHNYKEFSELKDGVNSRLRDCIEALSHIGKNCDDREIDEIWFLGDCFQLKNNIPSEVIKYIMDAFSNLIKDRTLLTDPGNHDLVSWSSNPVLLELFQQYLPEKKFQLIVSPSWIEKDNFRIYAEPFTRKVKELNERIVGLKTNPDRDIFFGHQDMIGMQYGGFQVENGLDPDVLSKKFKWSFIGHCHDPVKIRKNVVSMGAALQHNFGDADKERGWWIFDTEKSELEYIKNDFSPQFRDIVLGEEEEQLDADNKNFYRIKIKGDRSPESLGKIRWKRISYDVGSRIKKRATISFSDKKEDIIEKYVKLRGGDLEHKKLIELGREYL